VVVGWLLMPAIAAHIDRWAYRQVTWLIAIGLDKGRVVTYNVTASLTMPAVTCVFPDKPR
jgi:hypothetical protein